MKLEEDVCHGDHGDSAASYCSVPLLQLLLYRTAAAGTALLCLQAATA